MLINNFFWQIACNKCNNLQSFLQNHPFQSLYKTLILCIKTENDPLHNMHPVSRGLKYKASSFIGAHVESTQRVAELLSRPGPGPAEWIDAKHSISCGCVSRAPLPLVQIKKLCSSPVLRLLIGTLSISLNRKWLLVLLINARLKSNRHCLFLSAMFA